MCNYMHSHIAGFCWVLKHRVNVQGKDAFSQPLLVQWPLGSFCQTKWSQWSPWRIISDISFGTIKMAHLFWHSGVLVGILYGILSGILSDINSDILAQFLTFLARAGASHHHFSAVLCILTFAGTRSLTQMHFLHSWCSVKPELVQQANPFLCGRGPLKHWHSNTSLHFTGGQRVESLQPHADV